MLQSNHRMSIRGSAESEKGHDLVQEALSDVKVDLQRISYFT